MNNIDISIIIPIYNGEKYIKQLITNIVSLNNDINYEILLINDCSKDESKLKIEEIIKNTKYNITLINNDINLGIAESRNKGLVRAKGKYITFVDQDDKLVKKYSSFIKELEKYSCDFLFSNYQIDNATKCINSKDHICKKEDIIKLERYLFNPNLFRIENKDISITSSIWNCIFNTSFIKNNRLVFFRYTSYEDDWLFLIECLKNANTIYLSSDYFYSWTLNIKSESHVNKYIDNYFEKSLALLSYAISSLKETGLNDNDLSLYKIKCNSNIILWCFYNECENNENINNNANVSRIMDYYKNDINSFISNSNVIDKIQLILLNNKLYKIVKFIQQRIIKRKYV